MSTPAYAQASRSLTLSGVITRRDGVQVSLNMNNIVSYTINDSISSTGIAIGAVCSASYTLSFSNPSHAYTPTQFDGAEVHMYLTKDTPTDTVDFGVWYVDTSTMSEQSVTIDLSGTDALKSRFNAVWNDSRSNYPRTIGSLYTAVVTAAGMMSDTINFPNSTVAISRLPSWGDDCTLRQVIGYIAACAGGFAHVNRKGKIEILTYNGGSLWELTPDYYTAFSLAGGQAFDFNCLQVKSADETDYTRYAVNSAIEDNSTNCIQITDNPLYTSAIAVSVKTRLALVPHLETGELTWIGDPNVKVGDIYTVTDLNNTDHTFMVLSQRFSFDGGMSVNETCHLPSINEGGDSYSTVGSIFDSNGNLSATHISGLDASVVEATYAHFNSLVAETVRTDQLLASFIDAVKLRAAQITAQEVTTDSLTATMANIMNATIKSLSAGEISVDTLQAGVATIAGLYAQNITSTNLTTDVLGAQLARIGVLTAGSASFDKATVRHLIASLLNVQDMVGDKVAISNLAVDYASIVNAYVGNLCVKAADDNYYQLTVDSSGHVTGVRTDVSSAEQAAGVTTGGSAIIETSINASDLSASSLKAVYALINRLDAARIDVGQLTAREAWIDYLRTADISNNGTIRMTINTAEQAAENAAAALEGVEEASQTATEAQSNYNTIARYMDFSEAGLSQHMPGSIYRTEITEDGFYVKSERQAQPIAAMNATDGVTVNRMRLGRIICKATSAGGWVWQTVD